MKFQTLTFKGWVDTVKLSNGSLTDDKVYGVDSNLNLYLTTVSEKKLSSNLLKVSDWTSGAFSIVSPNWRNYTCSKNGTEITESDNIGEMCSKIEVFMPCAVNRAEFFDPKARKEIRGYYAVDRTEENLHIAAKSRYLNLKHLRMGADNADLLLNEWKSANGGYYTVDSKNAASLQAILVNTGIFSSVSVSNVFCVKPLLAKAFHINEATKIPASTIELFFNGEGERIYAVRREIFSGNIFIA